MRVYDTWARDPKRSSRIRFWIANALWKGDVSLMPSVKRRISELTRVIKLHNESAVPPIHSVIVDVSVLGPWHTASEQEKVHALRDLAELLSPV
jgi:hypothetical protein